MYTPLELQKIIFTKTPFSGYKVNDVDETFDLVIRDYEKMYLENKELHEKIENLEDVLKNYKGIEETLHSALIIAQNTSEDMQKNAQEKADQIINEANLEAKSILLKNNDEITILQVKKEEMRQSVTVLAKKLTALLNAQIDILKELSEDI